jgi:Xaa-Pro aminopeptidase
VVPTQTTLVSAASGDDVTEFSAEEIAHRSTRLRALLDGSGLHALIAYDDGAKLGGGNVRYIGGFAAAPPPSPSYVVVGPTGPATIVVMESRAGTVGNHAKSFCGPGVAVVVGDRADWAGAIAQALEQVGATSGTVGTDGIPTKDPALLDKLRTIVPDVTFRAENKLIEKVRRDKSPLELEFCRRASQISKHVFDVFERIVEPGMPHELAAAEAAHLAALEDGEELVLALGSGEPWIWSSATAARLPGRFQGGQPVSCEVNVKYRGYFSQVARTWPLGTVTRDRQRMIDAVRAAHDRMIEAVHPGALPRDVFRAGLAEIRRHDFDYSGIRYGHGLGLTIGEGWDFADDDDNPTGTVLTPLGDTAYAVCHPFLFERDSAGTVTFNALHGDPWVMGTDGPELLW